MLPFSVHTRAHQLRIDTVFYFNCGLEIQKQTGVSPTSCTNWPRVNAFAECAGLICGCENLSLTLGTFYVACEVVRASR